MAKRLRLRDDRLPGANAAGTGARGQPIAQSGKKAGKLYRGRHVAWDLNTLIEAKSLQESLIDFGDEFKH